MDFDSFDNYKVIRRIGVGAMGNVYEVEHKELGVRYALKTFKLKDGESDFLRFRFLAEGRTLARIHQTLKPLQAALVAVLVDAIIPP